MATRTKALIIAAFVLFLFLILATVLLLRSGQPTTEGPAVSPTPRMGTSELRGVRIVSSIPEANATNVPVKTSQVRITLSGGLKQGTIEVSVYEKSTRGTVPNTVSVNGANVVVDLLRVLAPREEYLVTLTHQPNGVSVGSFRFTIEDAPAVDTYPFGLFEEQERNDLKERPDIYVANKLPYSTDAFTIDARVSGGSFVYSAQSSSLSEDELKQVVQQWLLSLGLTDRQISGLTIEYRAR